MKKSNLLAFLVFTSLVLSGCSTEQVVGFAKAMQIPPPGSSSPQQQVQQPARPVPPPVSLVSAGTLNQCRTEVSPNRDALLVTAGHNNANQYFTCAVGSPMTIGRAEAGFNATLIPLLCDMAKPIVNTTVEETMSIINCTYVGPKRLPQVVDNLPIRAI